jgi:cell division protein FtsL
VPNNEANVSRRDTSAADVDEFPLEAPTQRVRLRRGGPRTPLPLLPLIAIAAGIGIAYVSETAHATQATYRATSLAAEQQQLRSEAAQLSDELARLQSSERIVAAAQRYGMRPADKWGYAVAHPIPIVPTTTAPELAGATGDSVLQRLIAAMRGAYGSADRGR